MATLKIRFTSEHSITVDAPDVSRDMFSKGIEEALMSSKHYRLETSSSVCIIPAQLLQTSFIEIADKVIK